MNWTIIDTRRSPKEITAAINRYARRHNMYASSVRNSTMQYRAAMIEDDVKRGVITLEEARAKFADRYPDTEKPGPNNVIHHIK